MRSAGFALEKGLIRRVPARSRSPQIVRETTFRERATFQVEKNVILDPDGNTSYETVEKLLDVAPDRTKCYVHSSALVLYKDERSTKRRRRRAQRLKIPVEHAAIQTLALLKHFCASMLSVHGLYILHADGV